MTWQIVLGIAVFLLILLLFMRVGSIVEYGEEGIRIKVRAGPIRLTIFPVKERKAKPKTEGKKKRKTQTKERESDRRGGDAGLFQDMIRPFMEAAAHTGRKLCIDLLEIEFTAAASNPAAAAIAFGGANAMLGTLIALLENTFSLKKRNVRTQVDYTLTSPVIYVKASFSLRLWETLWISHRFGWFVLRAYRRRRRANRENSKKRTADLKS